MTSDLPKPDNDNLALLTIEQVLRMVPVSRTTLLKMEREGRFPAGHFISGNRKVWISSDVEQWMRALPTESAQRRRGNNPAGRPRRN